MKDHLNIPKLRFAEFNEKWEKKRLGNLLEFKNGINASKEQYGRGVKFINVLDILNNDFITHDRIVGSVDVTKEVLDKYPVAYGDILFQRSSETREEVGSATVYLDKENIATFGGFVIRGKKIGEYEPYFLNKLLKTDAARDNITSKSGGSTRYNVGQETLSSVVLSFPSLPEQQKIASFLTKVDEKVTQLKTKKRFLEQYKMAMMQKIFSQEIQFRDDSGEKYPDWEEKTLDEISNEHLEKNLKGKYKEVFSVAKNKGVINQIEHLGRSFSASDISNYKVCHHGDLVYTKSPTSDFPFGIIKQNRTNRVGVVSPLYCVFKPINFSLGYIIHEYFSTWINTYNYLVPLVQKGAKNTMNINNKDFLEGGYILLPIAEMEQIKIANFLSAIDKKIAHTQTQINKAEQWKNGLLQQMFV